MDTSHCRLQTPRKSCGFGDALTHFLSRHNLIPAKLAQILTLAHLVHFQHVNFEERGGSQIIIRRSSVAVIGCQLNQACS